MLRQILIPFLLLLMPLVTSGQNATIDSLENQLTITKGEKRSAILLKLAEQTRRQAPEESIRYVEELLDMLKLSPDALLQAEAYYQMGWAHIYQRDYQAAHNSILLLDSVAKANENLEALTKSFLLKGRVARQEGVFDTGITVLDSGLVLAEKTNDRLIQLQLLNELGSINRREGKNAAALEYHQRALALSKALGDQVSLSTTLGYIGIVHDIMGNYDEALKAHQQTLDIRSHLEDKRGVAAVLTNLGILHQKIRNYEEANAFYQKALSIWKELDRELEQAATYNNLGAVQDLLGQDDEALVYYQNALEIWKKHDATQSIAIALRNIGSITARQGNYEEALNLHEESLAIRKKLGDQFGSASSLIDIAELHQNLGRSSLALEAALEGLRLAELTGSWPVIRDAHEMLSDLYEAAGQYDRAIEHYKSFKSANDSLFNIESQSVIAELQQEYKTKEQQQQIEALQQQEKIQTLRFWILAGGTLLIGLVLVLIYSRYRLKKRAHDALEKLHEKEIDQVRLEKENAEATANFLQAENERKSQELEAARDLQLSMLPDKIPKSPYASISALMKTAAEVGGDYYDFHLTKEGTLTVVIGDATGHGVKAGTMVTATKSLFNLLAGEVELTRILELSSEALRKMALPKLYMVLALLRLKKNCLQLAGAGIPPALVYRARTGEVEQIPLKGMPLGSAADYPYKQQTITLNCGDVVMLCTDGFPELFNGNGRMIGYEMMPQLLREVGNRSPDEIINHFKNAALEWIGSGSQNDDLTFIVLKSTVDQAVPATAE